MNQKLPEVVLARLSEFIELNLALHFPPNRWNDLERNLIATANEFGYSSVDDYIQQILSSPMSRAHSDQLAAHLTINETYFWREPSSFTALNEVILPDIILRSKTNGKRLRIWSVGCSGGEEPYSIAIALSRFIPNYKDWNISILATDLNPRNLSKASSGIYGNWSFRGTPSWLKEKYFKPLSNGKFQLIPEIKKMVTFEYLNLAEDKYPTALNGTNAMDIIYCRNVLMYFNQKRFQKVVKGLHNALVEGGFLMVSSSELSIQNFADFSPINRKDTIIYQKISKKIKKQKVQFKDDISLQEDNATFNLDLINAPESIDKKETPTESVKNASADQLVSDEVLRKYSEGKYNEVISNLQKEMLNPEEQRLLIKAYANMGQLSEAYAVCQKLLSTNKLDANLYYLCATILQELNQPNEAIVSLKRAIYIDPDFVLSFYSLGSLYLKKGQINESKRCYKNALLILNKQNNEDIVPESEGLTIGRFKEIINATIQTHALS